MDEQLSFTKGASTHGLQAWIACATTSLPVPVSPSTSTGRLDPATCRA
jgi:hypothetical protein